MNSLFEKWYPLFLGSIFAILSSFFCTKNLFFSSLKVLFSATTTLSGIAIGFLATAMSILLTIIQSYIMQQIINAKVYDKLINYFMDAIQWLFVLMLLSFIGLVFDITKSNEVFKFLAVGVWSLAFMTSGLSSYRVIYLFTSILRAAKH